MHTGFISFCDRVCYNIKSLDTKDVILNELETRFGIQILQKHWHRLDEKGLQHIIRVPHLACLRSNGNPYYIVFTLYEDVPCMFFVDKKVQPGYQKPRMVLGRGQWDESLSAGTIFDGEMVKTKDNRWIFLINDLIAYQGRLMVSEHLPARLNMLKDILEKQYTANASLDVCRYEIKRYANATQQGTNALIEWSQELPYTNRGIYYWPFSRKYKPKLYNFDESLIKAVSVKVKETTEFRVNTKPPTETADPPSIPSPNTPRKAQHSCDEIKENGDKVLWLRRTDYPDVYDVYPTDNGMLHGNRLGIAFVKTLEDSRWLRNIFKTATVTVYIPFVCTMEQELDKWKPIALATGRKD